LRGPAGLFKDEEKHPLCWSTLENCNANPRKCPIDIITFHRKGNGNAAEEILNGSLDLLNEFAQKYPNLTGFKYSNSEADPIKKWSEPRDFQADTRYGAVLVETVLGHWQAIYDGRMHGLESISHDNSFLNFHPNYFTQRTLIARFQMNNTTPKHSQFVQKPVFSALGLLSNLANLAGKVSVVADKQLSYVITTNDTPGKFYSCVLLWSHVNLNTFTNKTQTFEININNVSSRNASESLFYFVEGLDNKRTNPWAVHRGHKSPAFPDFNVLEQMRAAQNPIVLSQPAKVNDGKIILNLSLMPPIVVSIRICGENVPTARKVRNLRLRKINSEEILLFWSDSLYREK
jgi:L-iduronidase